MLDLRTVSLSLSEIDHILSKNSGETPEGSSALTPEIIEAKVSYYSPRVKVKSGSSFDISGPRDIVPSTALIFLSIVLSSRDCSKSSKVKLVDNTLFSIVKSIIPFMAMLAKDKEG